MLVYLETGVGACLKMAASVKAAQSQTLKEVGTRAGVQVARKATQRDIELVTGMGGFNPAAYATTQK